MSGRSSCWTPIVLALAAASAFAAEPLTGRPPNLLLIVADDLGYSDLGAFGSEIDTPNLDRLAARGRVFTHFYTAASCSPTRAMLLTAMDHHRTGFGTLAETRQGAEVSARGYEGRLDPALPTIAELLRKRGYRTSIAGKWHLGLKPDSGPRARGFDDSYVMTHGTSSHYGDDGYNAHVPKTEYFEQGSRVVPPPGFYSSDDYATRVIGYIGAALDAGQPFFSYLSFTAPHYPLHAPRELIDKYLPRYEVGWDEIRAARIERLREVGLLGSGVPAANRPVGIPAWKELDAATQRFEVKRMATYAAMVERLDANVGRVLELLQTRGAREDTVVAFLSDNGAEASAIETLPEFQPWFAARYDPSYEALGGPESFQSYGPAWASVSNLPFNWHKGVVAEGGVRSPLLVSGPGIAVGRRSQAVTVADLAATVLALAGAVYPRTVDRRGESTGPDGIEFTTLLRATSPGTTAHRIDYFESFGTCAAVLDGRWKALRLGPPWGDNHWQLHDLQADPAELIDLSPEQPGLLRVLVDSYEDYAARVGAQPLVGRAVPWGYSSRFPRTPASGSVATGTPLPGIPPTVAPDRPEP